jgi:pimeloyl-ACP methyl ester carboxylesterase
MARVELVQTSTVDGLRLDGSFQAPPRKQAGPVDAFCLVHGTGGNFYGSTLLDAIGERLLALGAAVLRVNTRGHDGISTAVTAQGGKRLGAAYEIVDDCRKDLGAWIAWLRQNGCNRIGLVGHSLGAVKCLYALAHEPQLGALSVLALSPPRLSYSWFCSSPESALFLETYQRAESLAREGQGAALMEVKLPLPFVITAAGFVEKYGPDERYNMLHFLSGISQSALVTFGSLEVQNNMAFRGAPEAVAERCRAGSRVQVAMVAGADHFYTGVRAELLAVVEPWVRAL